MNPFELTTQLCTSQEDNWADIGDKNYNAFMVNRAMSYNLDTVMLANEMTQRYNALPQWQYDFYRCAVTPKKKRFAKWAKPDIDTDIDLIVEAFNVTKVKAVSILALLNTDNITTIRNSMFRGGHAKK